MELVFDKDGCRGITKSPVIYEKKDGNVLTPVLYFHKPKNVPQEKFEQVVRIIINRAKNE